MILDDDLLGGPFDTVLDVGGNVGEFAEAAVAAWPAAKVISFEPVPHIANANRARAHGLWQVVTAAVSADTGKMKMLYCVNQHSASTLHTPGTVRRERFGIVDAWEPIEIQTVTLDNYLGLIHGRLLIKIDVEGHAGAALLGALAVLDVCSTVIVELENHPGIFGQRNIEEITRRLRSHGLTFVGVHGTPLLDPRTGAVLQFDAVYRR